MSYYDYSNLTAPENAHTLSEFVTAGKTHAENRYVDFCYMEKLGSINFVVRNILRDYIEELKEETTLDFDPSTLVNDAESNENLTIKDELDEEIPEAATVGFDDFGEEDQ